jgi:hypothetical protein
MTNGIVKSNVNGIYYIFWKDAEIVKPYVRIYLDKIFPGKLIVKELNAIDFSIPEENLPVEIQATPYPVRYARFEQAIKNQIEQNIIAYDRCWFFFDSELFRCMKNASMGMSINMDWFRNYIKEEKLKVFTINHVGIIDELEYKDFDFLADVSQTCKIAYESDEMTLNRNKMLIFANVINGYGFSQEEIDSFEDKWRKDKKPGEKFNQYVARQSDSRMKSYRNIIYAIGDLPGINNILDLSVDNVSTSRKHFLSILGIFANSGMGQGSITRFVDIFDICKYFPGYIRNYEIWQKLKGLNLDHRQFSNVIMGKTDVIKGIEYYWN